MTIDFVCHPNVTVGFRVSCCGKTLVYIPDHEPALGFREFPPSPEWTSGHELAEGADVLIHDAQYTDDEYAARQGWGHSSLSHAIGFASQAGCKMLVPFHFDPTHDDEFLDRMLGEARDRGPYKFEIYGAQEGRIIPLD